ncbi:MAG: tyrosine recombinase XerC [Clostridiales bacterium]|jgi:site-specific recombinase XerD|nr:tyrosine recombinase XerC [Clostridiales bacterium]
MTKKKGCADDTMNDFARYDPPRILLDFLNYIGTIKGKSPNTVQVYFYDLRLFFRFLLVHYKVADKRADLDTLDISEFDEALLRRVTLGDLFAFLSFVYRERENSNHARARKVATLKSFFSYLFSKAKLLDTNPAAELESPKIAKRIPRYLNIDESKHLLVTAGEAETEQNERNFAIITLFLNCGMRLSELVGINLSNIRDDSLTIVGKGDKERAVYLNAACRDAISAYLRIRPNEGVSDRNALFLSKRKQRISKNMVQRIVKQSIGLAGLDTAKYSTHKLRHTAATLMYRHGHVNIRALQEILGHESIATTEIYTHLDAPQLREAAESNPLADFHAKAEADVAANAGKERNIN